MITEKENTRISKFLSLVLRHRPELIDLKMDTQGWADVQELISKSATQNMHFDLETLKHIVDTNNKKRFSFNESMDKIRASQGHSVEVELEYAPVEPPAILYHGTAESNVKSIQTKGLEKRSRHHVHLSADTETAGKVGQRHGKPFIFEVLAAEMHQDGFLFYRSDNGVWLTDSVPAKYLRSLTE